MSAVAESATPVTDEMPPPLIFTDSAAAKVADLVAQVDQHLAADTFSDKDLDKIFEIAGDRQVLLVNAKVERPWQDLVNQRLAAAADRHSNAVLVAGRWAFGHPAVAMAYALVLGTVGTHSINGSLYSKMPYDMVKDFTPVGMIGATPNVLVVNANSPAKSVAELVALAKKSSARPMTMPAPERPALPGRPKRDSRRKKPWKKRAKRPSRRARKRVACWRMWKWPPSSG